MQYLRGRIEEYKWNMDASRGTCFLVFNINTHIGWTDSVHVQHVMGH